MSGTAASAGDKTRNRRDKYPNSYEFCMLIEEQDKSRNKI